MENKILLAKKFYYFSKLIGKGFMLNNQAKTVYIYILIFDIYYMFCDSYFKLQINK